MKGRSNKYASPTKTVNYSPNKYLSKNCTCEKPAASVSIDTQTEPPDKKTCESNDRMQGLRHQPDSLIKEIINMKKLNKSLSKENLGLGNQIETLKENALKQNRILSKKAK